MGGEEYGRWNMRDEVRNMGDEVWNMRDDEYVVKNEVSQHR
jgi:hypothetical protein